MPYGYEMIRVWGTVAKGEEPWVWVVVMSGGIINGSVAYVEMGGELGGGEVGFVEDDNGVNAGCFCRE